MSLIFINSKFSFPKMFLKNQKLFLKKWWKHIFHYKKPIKMFFSRKIDFIDFVMFFLQKYFGFQNHFWNIFLVEKQSGTSISMQKLSGIDLWCFQNVLSTHSMTFSSSKKVKFFHTNLNLSTLWSLNFMDPLSSTGTLSVVWHVLKQNSHYNHFPLNKKLSIILVGLILLILCSTIIFVGIPNKRILNDHLLSEISQLCIVLMTYRIICFLQ